MRLDNAVRLDNAALVGTFRQFAAISNSQAGFGTSRSKSSWVRPSVELVRLTRQELQALPRKDAILARAIELFPRDARSAWLRIAFGKSAEGPAALERYLFNLGSRRREGLTEEERRAALLTPQAAFERAAVWARQYGDAFVLIGVADGRAPSQPIDWANVRSLRRLAVLDRYQVRPRYWLGSASDPEHYEIIGGPGEPGAPAGLWHRDRVLRFPGKELDDSSLRSNGGYHDSILQSLFFAWAQWMQGLQSSAEMLVDYDQAIFKSAALAEQLGEDFAAQNELERNAILERLLAFDLMRSTARVAAIDKELEEFEYVHRNYSGAQEIQRNLQEAFIAVTGIPRSKLLGQLPSSGISTANTAGLAERYEWGWRLADWSARNYLPHYQRLVEIAIAAADSPLAGEPDDWRIEVGETMQYTLTERQEQRKLAAETDEKNIAARIYTNLEARGRYAGAEWSSEIILDEKQTALLASASAPPAPEEPAPNPEEVVQEKEEPFLEKYDDY